MRLVLVGPPGSGKGTQAKLLTQRLNLRYIGTGDILREAIRQGTPAGKLAEPAIKQGKLVPDDLVNALVSDLFSGPNPPERYVLDGYPRTHTQAEWFEKYLAEQGKQINAVVQFVVSDEEVVRRISGRRVCPVCGAVYHVTDRTPKVFGKCDVEGADLVLRPDDSEETIRARLAVYHENTNELVAFYRRTNLLCELSTLAPVEQIYNGILDYVSSRK